MALFDRARGEYRDRQRIVEVAHIKDYYAFETDSGELRFDVERMLGGMESTALPIIRKLQEGHTITGDERFSLALYAAFQHTRTPVFQDTLDSMGSLLAQHLVRMAPTPSDGESMTEAEIAEYIGVEMHRHATLRMMLNISPEIARKLYETDWVIARCPDDETSFITTDSPFCLIPGEDYVPQPFSGVGIQTPGILKTLPLSQSTLLFMTEPGEGLSSYTLTHDQVRETNVAIAVHCQNFVFGRDLTLVEQVVKASGVDKAKWRSRITSN